MIELKVSLGERSYPILVGAGLLQRPGLLTPYIKGQQAMVVTNKTVAPLFLNKLMNGLEGVRADVVELEDGEQFKTLGTYRRIIDALMRKRHNRTTTLIALGGGVIGDLTGFAAATFQRGVAFIQVPTTLLAQVDSSVGGKTGVNHPAGKNMIGAFHQPSCVLADTSLLEELPAREYRAGLAEVVKYGVIRSADFFTWLERKTEALAQREASALAESIRRSCAIKAEVVRLDEREQGLRAVLNYGHTFAHALEVLTDYKSLLHGEAVAIGMVLAADCACRHGLLSRSDAQRITALLAALFSPTQPPSDINSKTPPLKRQGLYNGDGSLKRIFPSFPDLPHIDPTAALRAMGMDKKVVDGRLRLVLPERIGTVRVTDEIDADKVLETLESFFSLKSAIPGAQLR